MAVTDPRQFIRKSKKLDGGGVKARFVASHVGGAYGDLIIHPGRDVYGNIRATVIENVPYVKGGVRGVRTYRYETVNPRVDRQGNLRSVGKRVKGTTEKVFEGEYRYTVGGRLENGFDKLMMGIALRQNGELKSRIQACYDRWDSMSEMDKRLFFDKWRAFAIEHHISSDPIQAIDSALNTFDASDLLEAIEDIMDEIQQR